MATSALPRIERTVTVTTFNTVFIEDHEVVHLVTPFAGPYYFNILNLGPCTVYYSDEVPSPGDSNTAVLPPGAGDNGIFVCCGGGSSGNGDNGESPGEGLDESGLRVVVGPPCACGPGQGPLRPRSEEPQNRAFATITVRLVRG